MLLFLIFLWKEKEEEIKKENKEFIKKFQKKIDEKKSGLKYIESSLINEENNHEKEKEKFESDVYIFFFE
jgi:hypothetical protein